MAQSRPNIKVKESLRQKSVNILTKDNSGCDTCPVDSLTDTNLQDKVIQCQRGDVRKLQTVKKIRGRPPIRRRLSNKNKADCQLLPNVGKTGSPPTTHSNMKTKQVKEEQDKTIDEDTIIEPKTRARKKASDINEEDKKSTQDEPKTSKEPKKPVGKPKAVVKKRPLGIRKTLRSKKALVTKEKVKNVIKQTGKRGRKPAVKVEPQTSQDKETIPLIPASEIKKEPIDDTTPNSRSSSPKTAGRRQRVSSDMAMMKTMLSDSPSSLVLGPRTSPYSMRSERSNSPSLFEGKNLRSGKPRKVKNNLLNEVVMKEQKKRRRLHSDSKTSDSTETPEDCKKLKRGRSCSRDGSEISKCSDNTESDLSLSETLNDTDSKELNKKLDKPKTDLDIDIENNVQISTTEKVPSLVDSKLAETKLDSDPSNLNEKSKKKLSLNRSTSLDSDNNNSNRIKIEDINASELEDKLLLKTENDTLLEARSSILTSMSKTFNSKEVSKNIRKARRGRKAAVAARPSPSQTTKKIITSTITNDANMTDDKHETLDTLSKEISDLINDLDQNIRDQEMAAEQSNTLDTTTDQMETKTATKFYGLAKPLSNADNVPTPETPIKSKDKDLAVSNENTPSKDDGENIRLHYEEDSMEKLTEGTKLEITFKSSPVASIDKLMDRLKVFEEFDKRRQRQELESKTSDGKSVMVTNDVVLIPKSGDIKPLKDIQSVRSPEKPIDKENVLSCFENNSAISIVKRDHQVRKSVDVDLPNSVTLIKRNSFSARKESTSSNHSKESDAISLFEKSLGKDVTLTEIRKSVDKSSPATQVDLHQFATLHPNNPAQNLVGVVIDSSQISITPRVVGDTKATSDIKIISKRKSRESHSRKSSESTENEEKMATIEKIKSPTHHNVSPAISITATPVALKSPEWTPIESAARPPENIFGELKNYIIHDIPASGIEPTKKEPVKINTPVDIAAPQVLTTPVDVPKVVEITKAVEIPKTVEIAKAVAIPKALEVPKTVEVAKTVEIPKTVEVPKLKTLQDTQIVDVPTDKDIPPLVEVPTTAKESPSPEEVKPPMEIIPTLVKTDEKKAEKLEVTEEIKPPTTKPKESKEIPEEPKTEIVEEKPPAEIKLQEIKPIKSPKIKSAVNSMESVPGPSKAIDNVFNETPESQKRKENVLRTLGLLTHKAAKEAKIEKAKEKERIYSGIMSNKSKASKSGDYTGTLKTVIRLNKSGGEKKKHRSSLKMTFQKSKYRGKPAPEVGEAANEDDAYYTIERREGGASATPDETEAAPEPVEPKETLNLVIPEKASSFSIHPGRLCMDQCVYCGGKFGLFDTPCHIAQIKSSERQKKVLDNEEKLTIDSCLCDACYRHVDRRANCPSYRKRPFRRADLPGPAAPPGPPAPPAPPGPPLLTQTEKSVSPPLEEESEDESSNPATASSRPSICHTEACTAPAEQSIRRKWLIKMRPSVNRLLRLKYDYPGLHTIPLCSEHYRTLAPLMACALCRRRLTKHSSLHFINHGSVDLNPLLSAAGVPARLAARAAACKACRYYCSLLQRPGHNDAYARLYRRKLLQIYNIEVPPESEGEMDESALQEDSKPKKKQRAKSKQRKSAEPEKDSESSERTSEGSPEKDKMKDDSEPKENPLEEDIESLISSNKIMVPNAVKSTESAPQSEGSEGETVNDMDAPMIPVDKQTELQYLLQKQNNPAQFIPKTNLTQKQRNIMKIQSTLSGIQKPGHQHRISEKNAKRIHKLGQIVAQNDKTLAESIEEQKFKDSIPMLTNITLNDECTIESIPNKRPADINTLKNKWHMSESFTQVKKNLSELSKNIDPKKICEVKYSNPVKRLETNPSISVRELFPGEEEMNLQCNIEFNNVKGITPEGWEKCNSMIQYDIETKKLWTELQRPYGNQSSFLRHLILLEKYFRSGDLVLSQNATPHAINYSDSVQSRLRAYDNIASDAPRRSEPQISLIEFRKKSTINGKSLLKSNQNDPEKESKKFMPPPGMLPKAKSKEKSKSKPLPPELIAINTPNAQGRKAIQNVLHNIQQLVKGVSASDPTEIAAAPLPPPMPLTPLSEPLIMPPKFDFPKEKKEIPKKEDTPKKSKTTSKPWRPTLMPITPENLAKIAREPTQVAVDGRPLPSLVQVLSSGKRFHITFQDYNKMCVMRREKIQQIEEQRKKPGEPKRLSTDENTLVTEIQPSSILGNGGTVVQNLPIEEKLQERKDIPELGPIGSNAATILKNVGLKNITIAPIPPKTATVTSQTVASPIVSSPSLLVTSTPVKLPQLGPAVTIVSETILSPPVMSSHMIMPKIPKSLTVIPQTVVASAPQNVMLATAASPAVMTPMDVTRP